MTEFEHTRAPLIAHLRELKRRLLWVVLVFAATSGIAYIFAENIYQFLLEPLTTAYGDHSGRRLIYTSLTEAFFTYVRLAFFGGACLTIPFAAWQIYLFAAPGLYKNERQMALPYIIFSPLLFIMGAALAYYFVFPLAWQFFLSFEAPSAELPIHLEARVSEYLSTVMQFVIGFGLAFQLPILLTLLVHVGIITVAQLVKQRRLAIVALFIAAAILTPPDIISQISLALPLILLYEISIFLCRRIEYKKME